MPEGDEKARLMKDFFKRENWLGPREQQRLAHHLFRDAPRGEDFEGSIAPPERHHRKHPDRIHPPAPWNNLPHLLSYACRNCESLRFLDKIRFLGLYKSKSRNIES